MSRAKTRVPTAAESVELYLDDCRASGQKSTTLKDHRSVLLGPASSRGGRRSMGGVALAKSSLGRRKLSGQEATELIAWFLDRHPQEMAAATVRRGASSFNGWLEFCRENEWISELVARVAMRDGLPRGNDDPRWLRPEQTQMFYSVIERPRFDEYDYFIFATLVETGLRTSEPPTSPLQA